MIVIRRRQHKHPVPRRFRDTIHDIRSRISRAPPAYSEGVPPEHGRLENAYVDGDSPLGAVGGSGLVVAGMVHILNLFYSACYSKLCLF